MIPQDLSNLLRSTLMFKLDLHIQLFDKSLRDQKSRIYLVMIVPQERKNNTFIS